MAKRNRVRVDRIIILILLALLIGGAIGFGCYKLFGLLANNDSKQEELPQIETLDGVRISLNDYTIYYDDNDTLGFSFIIADINFNSGESISFDLGNLQTSEKIFLNDISKYTVKLDTSGYDLSKLEINTTGIVSENNNVNAKLFIPYSTDSNSLAIYNLADATNSINLDLTKDAIPATTLKLKDNSEEIVVGTTTVYVSKAYISSTMLHSDERYPLPSNLKVFTYEISVSEAKDNAQIVDAILLLGQSTYENHCLSSDYQAIDCENILGENLSIGTSGGLFFEVADGEGEPEDGTLLIKFSNQSEWVEIENN